MPTKELEKSKLFLSVDGENFESISDEPLEIVLLDDLEDANRCMRNMASAAKEISIELCNAEIAMRKLLVILGFPSNNWLKMHGYPMRRKRG